MLVFHQSICASAIKRMICNYRHISVFVFLSVYCVAFESADVTLYERLLCRLSGFTAYTV